ncbi:MAG: hypothetical protein IPG34_19405 [Rhodocyclaceae bacterium]|nr:hypothetical protein [Rhodocyclaceae bacterium]
MSAPSIQAFVSITGTQHEITLGREAGLTRAGHLPDVTDIRQDGRPARLGKPPARLPVAATRGRKSEVLAEGQPRVTHTFKRRDWHAALRPENRVWPPARSKLHVGLANAEILLQIINDILPTTNVRPAK